LVNLISMSRRCSVLIIVVLGGFYASGCGKDNSPTAPQESVADSYARFASAEEVGEDVHRLRPREIGIPVEGMPWIAHVRAVDLDQDGLMDVLVCDSKGNQVSWMRQTPAGGFEETIMATRLRAPVHAEAADMDEDGDLDVLVSSMSVVFPHNGKIGAVFILENDGNENFEPHLIIENTDRVTDVRAADFDQDGRLDLAVGQFGYDQGSVSWLRAKGGWEFERIPLLELSGTVNVGTADFDQNGREDMVALVSQQWEEIHLFLNVGHPDQQTRVIWGSTNEDYSLSGMSLADINKDGLTDVLFSNGDGFGPNPEPGPKPWHGVQFLENKGNGQFKYHRIGRLGGAYSPIAADLDQDGDTDVVATAAFNDWSDPESASLVWFRNNGADGFEQRILARRPIYLMTLDVADMDGDGGKPSIVTGGFHTNMPFRDMSRVLLWEPAE